MDGDKQKGKSIQVKEPVFISDLSQPRAKSLKLIFLCLLGEMKSF